MSKYFFWPKTFSDKNFCLPNFFWPKFFSTKIWFSPKFFEILNFGLVWATLVRYSFIRFNFDFHNRSKYVYVMIYQELNLASIVRLMPAQLQLLLVKPFISSSSRLTVSAWVSPSSTPAFYLLCYLTHPLTLRYILSTLSGLRASITSPLSQEYVSSRNLVIFMKIEKNTTGRM